MTMKQFLIDHQTVILFGLAYAGLGLIACLPVPGDPRPFSTKLYETLYTFLHLMSNKIVDKHPNLASVTITPGTVTTTPTTIVSNPGDQK